MKNGPEIERRWLLATMPDYPDLLTRLDITQSYGIDESGPFRIRMQFERQLGENGYGQGPTQYTLTRKEKVSHGIANEIETDIGFVQYERLYSTCTTAICKSRYKIEHNGLIFEIDFFDHVRLLIMEVELTDIMQTIEIPDQISKVIIKEITGEEEFSNFNLSKIPIV